MRTIVLALMVFAFSNNSFAQLDKVRFGVTANPGITWLKPDNSLFENGGVRTNFTFGLIVDYTFGNNERYAFNTGLQINLAGGKINGMDTIGGTTSTSSLTAKIQYLEIPLSIKLRSNETSQGMIFYGQLGFVPGVPYRKRANYKHTEPGSTTTQESNNIELKNLDFNPVDIQKVTPFHLGLTVEAGMEYALSENTWLIGGLFFNTGFTNVLKDKDSERIAMRNFGLRLGVMF